MNDYPNSGNLFPANHMQVFRQGKVDIEGLDHEMIIVEVTTPKGNKIYQAFTLAGTLYINKKKDENKDWDISGEIEVNGEEMMSWGRRKFDKNNNSYTRMSFAPAKPKEDSGSSAQAVPAIADTPDLDDDIPF